jgi:hypothetical protein
MTYGDKRDYPKIDIFVMRSHGWEYQCSTTWARTCKEAKEKYIEKNGGLPKWVKANFHK